MSKLVCTMPVRNEAWVLGLSARAVLMWCDLLVVLDHRSTDTSASILEQIGREPETCGRVIRMYSQDAEWEEMKHRQSMLMVARQYDATHIVMVDADEVLTGNLLPSIRALVEDTPKGQTLQIPWRCLRGGVQKYHYDGTWGTARVSVAFADEKRCCWQTRDGYDFHHRHPMGRPASFSFGGITGGLMHLQFASDRRLRAKQALYKMLEVIRWPGRQTVEQINRMYNLAVYGFEQPQSTCGSLSVVPGSWWAPYAHLAPRLHLDADPWQEAECQRLYSEHGAAKFAGLDLFGVIR